MIALRVSGKPIALPEVDQGEVADALHKMRVVGPTNASTAKSELGYAETFSKAVRADLANHPGFRDHCAPAQEAMHASHATPAGVIIRAAGHSTANGLQYATNVARMGAEAMKQDESGQSKLF